MNREVHKKKTPVKTRKRGTSNMKLGGGGGGVVEFRSPAEFPEDVFESAHMLNSILQLDIRPGLLMGRRVTVRYSDDKVDSALHRILRKAPPTKAPNSAFVAVLKMVPLWQFVGRFGRLRPSPAPAPPPPFPRTPIFSFSCMQ